MLSTTGKHGGLRGHHRDQTQGDTNGCDNELQISVASQPQCGIHGGPRENSGGPGGQRLCPGRGHTGSIRGRGRHRSQGRASALGLQEASSSTAQNQSHGLAHLQGRLERQFSWVPGGRGHRFGGWWHFRDQGTAVSASLQAAPSLRERAAQSPPGVPRGSTPADENFRPKAGLFLDRKAPHPIFSLSWGVPWGALWREPRQSSLRVLRLLCR